MKRRKTSSRVLAGLASIANYGRFHSTKIPVLISKVPRAQWNSIFRLHIPDASHRAFGYCSRNGCKSGTGDSNCVKFGPTYRNDQTSQSGPSLKVVPNIPVGPNRNGPFDLISNGNFRNFGLNGKRPIFVAEEGSEGMQVNLGLKGSQKGGNTIREKRKIIYFSCIGYMYFRWFWTEQVKSYSGSRTCRGRKSPSSEQTSAYSFFFVTETCAGGGIPTLFVSIIARAGHTGVCPGTKA